MSDHGSEQPTPGPSEIPATEATTSIEVSDHWKTRCLGLTDRYLRIAEKISTLEETSEGEEQWMSKWGVHPQSWPQFWRSFLKESKNWNVVLSEDLGDLSLEEVAGFGFVDQDQDDDSDIREEPDADPDMQDEFNTDGALMEREIETNHEVAISPENSVDHEYVVQYAIDIEHPPLPAPVSRDTNPSTRKTRSKTQSGAPISNVQGAEGRIAVETSIQEASDENPAASRPHRVAKEAPLAASIQRSGAHKTPEASPKETAVGNLVLRHAPRSRGQTLDRESSALTDAGIQFEAPHKPGIPSAAHHTHKSHIIETVAPRTVAYPATIPRTVLGSHGESHDQGRGLGTCPPKMTQVAHRVPIYQAPQEKSPTFIAPAQNQEAYRRDRPPPLPVVGARATQPGIATRTQTVSLARELMFLKPMEALKKARREAKAAGRSRFG
ncbi:hypothetical protein LRP88_02262 [Fusarium phalaenopsidis]